MSLVLIQELPAGRSPVQTRALRDDRPEEREQVLGEGSVQGGQAGVQYSGSCGRPGAMSAGPSGGRGR